MSITLTFGWWLIPAIITLIAFGKWGVYAMKRQRGVDYDFGIDVLLGLLVAGLVSMTTWTGYLLIITMFCSS